MNYKSRLGLWGFGKILTDDRGFLLTVALVLLATLTLVGTTAYILTSTDTKIGGNYKTGTRTFYVAEGGISHARQYLLQAAASTGLNPLLAGSSGNPPTPVPVSDLQDVSSFGAGQGTYSVFVANNLPADPDPEVDTDYRVWVTSVGTYQSGTQRVRALVEVNPLPTPPSAIDVFDGFDAGGPVGFVLDGNSFQVTGNDTASPESAGACGTPGTAKTGITVESGASLTELDGAIDASQEASVTGDGGNQSIAQDNSLTVAQVEALKNELISKATVTLSGTVTSNIGSPAAPVIAYANDHLDLEGTGTGYGILVVDRRLRMRGDYKWEGLILLVGQGEFEIEGDAKVYGGILAANTGAYSGNSGETRVRVGGSATVAYSSQALCRASQAVPTMILAWERLY